MFKERRIGPIIQFRLARRLFGRNLYFTAAYFVDGLLIDTGFHYSAHNFFENLRHKSVEQIVNTHSHEDHVGANYLFQTHLGLKAKAHSAAIDLIRNPPAKLKLYRRVVWGVPESAATVPIEQEIETENYTLKVIGLPGHSEDHIGFFEPDQGWLFGGDLFLSVKVKVLRYDENIYKIIDSLKKAIKLPVKMYFCSSGKILTRPIYYLKLKLEFYENVQYNVLKLRQEGFKLKKIRDEVLGREEVLTYLSQGEFSKINLVKAF